MKVIVAGSREGFSFQEVCTAIEESPFKQDLTEIVSGTARGVDKHGEYFAYTAGYPCTKFPADWEKHGKSAGYRRNTDMAVYADALIALWDGSSKGTKHMIEIMKGAGKPVYVYQR